MDGTTWTISNEFAAVEVSLDYDGHDRRLRLHDVATGHVIWLDALVLACLARMPARVLDQVLNPDVGRDRET